MSVLPEGWRDDQGRDPETELMQLKRGLHAASRRGGLAAALRSYFRLAKVTAVTAGGGFAMGFVVYFAVAHLSAFSPMAALTEAVACPGCEAVRAVDPASTVEEELRSRARHDGRGDGPARERARGAGSDSGGQAASDPGSLFDGNLLVLLALALAAVAAIVFTAPNLAAGMRRLKLLQNVMGIVIVGGVATGGIILLVWGIAAGSKELVYLALVPLIVAGLSFRAFTRHRRTWQEVLGFGDTRERTRSFLDETGDLWRSVFAGAPAPGPEGSAGAASVAPGHAARAAAPAAQGQAAEGDDPASPGAPSFSAMLGSGQIEAGGPAGRLLERAMRFAAHRLTDKRISVFPETLQLEIALAPARGEGPAFAGGRRPELTLRRDTGAPLMVSARTDLPFLELTSGRRRRDGTYPIEIALLAHRLAPGPFAGTIEIATGDSMEPRIVVPVAGTVG